SLCIRARPGFVWPYLLRGYVLGQTGAAAAEEDFARAALLATDADARYVLHVNRGVLAIKRGQIERALGELSLAVKVRPDGYHAHVNLAQAYRQRRELGRAAEALDCAIRLAPQRPELYRTRARLRLERGE